MAENRDKITKVRSTQRRFVINIVARSQALQDGRLGVGV